MVGKRYWSWWPSYHWSLTALKKAQSATPLYFGVKSFSSLFFSGTIWDVGSCAQQADPLFQNRNHFGGGKSDFTFPRLRDSFCFATALEPAVLLLREQMSYWRLTKKTTINCHWDGALFLQNSIPALLVQGSSQNILRKRWRNKDGAGKFNWCREAAGEGPNSVARSTVFEMPVPVF